jgi:predicted ArsR family transcriptional regulator
VSRHTLQVEQPSLWSPGQQCSSPAKRKLDRQKVLTWFVAYQQGTADEAAEGLGMDVLAVRPRVTELVKRGLLVKSERPRRPTRHGGTAAVVEVTLAGEREQAAKQRDDAAA